MSPTPRLLPLLALLPLSLTPTTSWATCTAYPGGRGGPSLEGCLRLGDLDIVLLQGEHQALNSELPPGQVLRADPDATERPVVRTRTPLLEALTVFFTNPEPASLSDLFATFVVTGSSRDRPVTVQGLKLLPLASDLRWLGGGEWVIGRVFEVQDGALVVEDCVVGKMDYFAGDGDKSERAILLRDDLDPSRAPDDEGGVLAFVSGRSWVRLERVEVSDIVGPGVRGAAVYATGADSAVEVVGGRYRDSRFAGGMLTANDGAQLTVIDEAGVRPARFERLRGTIGGAVLADEGGVVELYGGIYEDNGSAANADNPFPRHNVGAHAAADRGGTLRIWNGEYRGGSAAAGGVAAARNARIEVKGGLFGDDAAPNTARLGGLFALWRDDELAGDAPTGLFSGAELRGGVAARNASEDEMYRGGDLPGDTPAEDWVSAGGAIVASRASVVLDGVKIVGNTVVDGGGGGVLAYDTGLEVIGGEIRGNLAAGGAGLYVQDGLLTLSGAFVRDNGLNGVGSEVGGGLFAHDVDVTVDDGTRFEGNRAELGGGLAVTGDSEVVLNQAEIVGNVANIGGGVAGSVSTLRVFGGRIADNTAIVSGGGLALNPPNESGASGSAVAVLTETEVSGNTARVGGGVAASSVDVSVLASTVEDNVADETGGGMYAQAGAVVVRDGLVAGNEARGWGGGLYVDGAPVTLEGVDVLGNSAVRGAAVVAAGAGGHRLVTNRFCGNKALEQAQILLDAGGAGDGPVTLAHNLVDGGLDGSHDLVLARGRFDVHHNHLVRSGGLAVSVVRGTLGLQANLIAYGATDGPVVGVGEGSTVEGEHNVLWGREGALVDVAADVRVLDAEGTLSEAGDLIEVVERAYIAEDPRLRGWADGPPDDACAFAAHHPRPDSPLLTRYERGMDFDPDDVHRGLWGGKDADLHPTDAWATSFDGDQDPAIFDCDDADLDVGDRLLQYVDGDGDGVGGVAWEPYDCTVQPGNVTLDGDCDDADPSVQDCPEIVSFYGSRCSSVPLRATLLPGALALTLLLLRRRRRHHDAPTS